MDANFEPKSGEWKRVLVLLLLAILIILAVASAFWTTPTSASSGEGQANGLQPAPTTRPPTSTPVHRPRPGGPGNSRDIAIFLVLEGVIIVLVGACAILLVNKLRGKP